MVTDPGRPGNSALDPWWSSTLIIEYENARGVVEKDGKPKGYTICATKAVKTGADRCFAAFASAGELDRWLGAGHRVDFREGGAIANADGNRLATRAWYARAVLPERCDRRKRLRGAATSTGRRRGEVDT